MSTQIAVRLADELVEYVDSLVEAGEASRAAVVTKALKRYRRQQSAERDAAILRGAEPDPELESWLGAVVPDLD
ncbi:MAG: antitoxin [Myxococcales bacterium]|nr:MAG: antitoxin [Myxococcales bacterium]